MRGGKSVKCSCKSKEDWADYQVKNIKPLSNEEFLVFFKKLSPETQGRVTSFLMKKIIDLERYNNKISVATLFDLVQNKKNYLKFLEVCFEAGLNISNYIDYEKENIVGNIIDKQPRELLGRDIINQLVQNKKNPKKFFEIFTINELIISAYIDKKKLNKILIKKKNEAYLISLTMENLKKILIENERKLLL